MQVARQRVWLVIMDDKTLRNELIALLEGGNAHSSSVKALKGVNPDIRTVRPEGMTHSVWELLEHARLSQQDILNYTLDPGWKSPDWPEGYWPANPRTLENKAWNQARSEFLSDLQKVIELVRDPGRDLTARIPHGADHTYLREVLLVADHNAYHLGQIVQVRKALGDWDS